MGCYGVREVTEEVAGVIVMLWYSCLLSFYDGGKGGVEQNYYPNRAHYKRWSGVELMEWS
jgi:hypothetical protein